MEFINFGALIIIIDKKNHARMKVKVEWENGESVETSGNGLTNERSRYY